MVPVGLVLQNLCVHELFEDGHEAPPVPVVGDPAAVVDLSGHEEQRVPGNGLLLVQQHSEDRFRGFQVAVVELVPDVPAQGPEFLPLQDDRVEEAQAPHQLVDRHLLVAALQVRFGDVLEGPLQVHLQAPRRLRGQLDAVLQDAHREVRGGHRGQEQPEVWMDRVFVLGYFLDDHL